MQALVLDTGLVLLLVFLVARPHHPVPFSFSCNVLPLAQLLILGRPLRSLSLLALTFLLMALSVVLG